MTQENGNTIYSDSYLQRLDAGLYDLQTAFYRESDNRPETPLEQEVREIRIGALWSIKSALQTVNIPLHRVYVTRPTGNHGESSWLLARREGTGTVLNSRLVKPHLPLDVEATKKTDARTEGSRSSGERNRSERSSTRSVEEW